MVDIQLINKVSEELKNQNLTVATAESCTGGLLAHYLTSISGSSEYYDRGVVTYSNKSKIELLDVKEETLRNHGTVSEQTARAMAVGIKNKSNVDIGIATTGIAGPTGGTEEKPVGLVYISIVIPNKTEVKKFIFSGDRLQIKKNTCSAALKMLLDHIG